MNVELQNYVTGIYTCVIYGTPRVSYRLVAAQGWVTSDDSCPAADVPRYASTRADAPSSASRQARTSMSRPTKIGVSRSV
jgi:hypothetical protein